MVNYEDILKKVEQIESLDEKIKFIESILDKVDEDIRKKLEVLLKDLQESEREPLESRLDGAPTGFSKQIDQIKFENYVPRQRKDQPREEPERREPKTPQISYEITHDMPETEEKRLQRLTDFLGQYELLPESGRRATSNINSMRQRIRDFYDGEIDHEKEQGLINLLTSTDTHGNYMIGSAPPPTRVAEILSPEQKEKKKYQLRRIRFS